jgi:hypothetical protein
MPVRHRPPAPGEEALRGFLVTGFSVAGTGKGVNVRETKILLRHDGRIRGKILAKRLTFLPSSLRPRSTSQR